MLPERLHSASGLVKSLCKNCLVRLFFYGMAMCFYFLYGVVSRYLTTMMCGSLSSCWRHGSDVTSGCHLPSPQLMETLLLAPVRLHHCERCAVYTIHCRCLPNTLSNHMANENQSSVPQILDISTHFLQAPADEHQVVRMYADSYELWSPRGLL